jgi:hypothetical protein
MVDAVAGNDLVNRIGLVAPWLQNSEIVEAVYGGAEGGAGLIEVSQAADAASGQIIPAAGPEGAEGVLMPIGGYYYEADRGGIPEYDDKWNNAGWEGWLTYHPADNPQRLNKPLAIVHSESAATRRATLTVFCSTALGTTQLCLILMQIPGLMCLGLIGSKSESNHFESTTILSWRSLSHEASECWPIELA